MNKKHKALFLALLMLVSCLLATGCDRQRKPVSLEDFKKVCDIELMEEVTLIGEEFESASESYACVLPSGGLSAFYLGYDNHELALETYAHFFDALEKGPAGTKVSMDGENYRSGTCNSNVTYTRVICVDNMFILVEGTMAYKTEIDKIISKFGKYPVSAV